MLTDNNVYKFKIGQTVKHNPTGGLYRIVNIALREESLIGSYNYISVNGGPIFNRIASVMEFRFEACNE